MAATLPVPPRPTPQAAPPPSGWAVQIGAFTTEGAARQAALNAHRVVGSGQARVESVQLKGQTSWRAKLIGLKPAEADSACAALARRKLPCMVLRPEPGQLARAF
jgi:hypothetical protein